MSMLALYIGVKSSCPGKEDEGVYPSKEYLTCTGDLERPGQVLALRGPIVWQGGRQKCHAVGWVPCLRSEACSG